MIKLNRNTIKARGFVEQYERSNMFWLHQCYRSYSYAKAVAEAQCREKMLDMNGLDFRIISFNSQTFTCAWLYEDKDGVMTLHVETRYNTYEMDY